MYLTEIQLTNFRNYSSQKIEPHPSMNILVGQNAQGKSNLLEAIYVLTTTKSQRTSRDSDLIKMGEDFTKIAADVVREKQNDISLEMVISKSEHKTVKVNTVKRSRIADAVGQLNSVIFSSEDLAMIKGDPSERRRFLNLEVSQISGQYVYALAGYKRALHQRNTLLKSLRANGGGLDTLEAWTEQLVAYGSIMIKSRKDFVKHLAELASPIHAQLTGSSESLVIDYSPSFDIEACETAEDIAARFRQELVERREQELARATTVRGPHRDDLSFHIDGMDVRYFGSQGQQRTTALSIKLAEIQLVEDAVGEPPVALLDDVMAELDEERRSHVFDLTFGRCQTFASATSLEEFPERVASAGAVFRVVKGEVTRQ